MLVSIIYQQPSYIYYNKIYQQHMQETIWKRSVNPKDININAEAINIIKNTLLEYKPNSQFYINVPDKSLLTIVFFLCFYDCKTMASKKINGTLQKINEAQLRQLNDEYFNTHSSDEKQLNIPKRAEQVSAKFNYHQRLIKETASKFLSLSLNSIFQHVTFKNKIQIREYREGSLQPFNKITFSNKQAVKNDIIIIPYQTGYYLSFFSSKNQTKNMVSLQQKEQGLNLIKQKELDQEQLNKFIKEQNAKKKSLKKEVFENLLDKQKANNPEEQEKLEKITFFVLLAFLAFFSYEAFCAFGK